MSDHHRAVPEPSDADRRLDLVELYHNGVAYFRRRAPGGELEPVHNQVVRRCLAAEARVAALTAELAAERERVGVLEAAIKGLLETTVNPGYEWGPGEPQRFYVAQDRAALLLRPGAGGEGTC